MSQESERRAQTIELFFDLTFAFALTQVTHILEIAHDWREIILVVSVITFLWWMYGGYVWLASHLSDAKTITTTLVVAMIGYFFIAVGIPQMHEGHNMIAGLGAVFVAGVHAFVFARFGGVAKQVIFFGTINIGLAAILLSSGFLPHEHRWIAQAFIIVSLLLMSVLYSPSNFELSPSHFVERHGLLLIMVFGESIISLGAEIDENSSYLILWNAGIAMLIICALWYGYFAGDDRRAEVQLTDCQAHKRGHMALIAYWFAFLVKIFGILILSAGLRQFFSGEEIVLAYWISIGTGMYFLGSALFRFAMKIPNVLSRASTTFGCALVALLHDFSGSTILCVVLLIMAIDTVYERRSNPA